MVHDRGNKSVRRSIFCYQFDKVIKEISRISRTTTSLRVKLDRIKRFPHVNNSFIGFIICINKECFPSVRKALVINSKTMILGSNIALSCSQVNTRLVMTSIPILHLISGSTDRKSQKLVSQTNSKERNRRFRTSFCHFGIWKQVSHSQDLLDIFDCLTCQLWVTRPIADENTIKRISLIKIIIIRDNKKRNTSLQKLSNNIVLHSAMISDNSRGSGGVVQFWFLACYLRN
mmetsp:Transcript_5680/g.7368  ORF Transcript_5680/g.7368 Transcript_5680/m.7368 type:complete len:231 (-) Transcript_5680:929-1621(-)